jgi:DUF1680 family protein
MNQRKRIIIPRRRHWLSLVLLLALSTMVATAAPPQRDYPHTPVPFTDVTINDQFWSPRMETNRKVTVWYDFQKCEETGRIANFARAGGMEEGEFQGIPFNDSDVVKVVEGAAYALALQPDPKLDKYLDGLIAKIAASQEDDGYLYTARTLGINNGFTGPKRWSNLRTNHELYNVGHMYEAAVAHFQATGKRTFLDVAIRNADLICQVFGPGEGQLIDVPGHEEIEIGLVKLYRATGDRKYLDQAKFFVDMRGRSDKRKIWGEYCQDHQPVVEQSEAVGHAVRGGYLYAGVADVAAIVGDQEYIDAIDRIWRDVVSHKLYLTGNVGQFGHGEGYEGAYQLTNLKAYNETCAAIALALWNQRMFLLHCNAKYVDVLERIIYNGFLSGVSLSGDRFFYPNPLACDMAFKFNHGALERSPWFGCSCCPVNVVRFIPSISGYIYAHRGDAAYVNLYIAGSGKVKLPDNTVTLTQETRYPWDGRVKISVAPEREGEFALHVRVPGWVLGRPLPSDLYTYMGNDSSRSRETSGPELSRVRLRTYPANVTLTVNGQTVPAKAEKGYAVIRRSWKAGDAVEFTLPMPVCRVLAHEKVEADRGRVAVERGPIVYCAEGVDHGGTALNLVLPDDAELTHEHRPDLLDGVTVIRATGQAAHRDDTGEVVVKPAELTLVPYYSWCHRGANEMAVWLPRTADLAHVAPPSTIASTSRATASHVYGNDSLRALNDQADPANSSDHSVPRMTWWDHRGTTEWVQYDLQQPTKVSAVEVYWFDDTGRGQCRVPSCWRLLYRDGDQWKPVDVEAALTVDKDKFNVAKFEPVTTTGLRIEVELQSEFSGGILEWRVVGGE